MAENYIFTVYDDDEELPLVIASDDDASCVEFHFGDQHLANVDRQQLGELGALFLTLAGEFDYDSIVSLIDGFGIDPERIMMSLDGIRDALMNK